MPRYDVPKAAPQPLLRVQQFVNTSDLEHDRDWLASPADLNEWLSAGGCEVGATRTDVRRARELREALRALLVANNAGDPYPPKACESLNRIAGTARLTLHFDARGELVLEPRTGGVAAAFGELVGIVFAATLDGTFARLKACRNCRWAFYDYSRNHRASWCSMSICGNRLKTRRYRARRAAKGGMDR